MNDMDRSEQDIPTQPGDRLRKILAASTEEDALQNETSQAKEQADLESAPVDDGMQQTNGEDLAEQNTPVEKEDAGTNSLEPSDLADETEMQGTSGQDEKNPELEDTAPIFKADVQPAEHNAVDGMTETTQDSDEQFRQQGNLSASKPFPGTSQFIGDDQTIAQSNQANTFDEKTKPPLTGKEQRNPSSYPPPPPLGEDFVPAQVNEIDIQATRVTPRAYSNTNRTTRTEAPIQNFDKLSPAETSKKPVRSKAKPLKNKTGNSSKKGCFSQFIIAGLFVFVLAVVGVITYGVYQYFTIASSLPSIEDLSSQASQFETTRILDRNNNVIYEIIDPNAGRRTYIPLEKMSPYIIAATIATEDKEFYNHPGFDPVALVRALWTNYTSGEIVSGASTITQQLARGLLFDQQERYEQTIHRKAREIVLATEINRKYTKEEILELYLNENYYSNFAYGIEAAAETYFNTTADQLTLGQAAFLAGLPQAPSVYDIFSNRDATINRQKQVLILMLQLSHERGCIFVSENQDRVCVDEIASAAKEIEDYNFQPQQNLMSYPHWVNYIRAQLEEQFDPQTIYRSGFTVYTTLDPELQRQAEQIVKTQVDNLKDNQASDGALIAISPKSGEILAMVGSADFYNEAISGQVNMAISPRQPGSSIKPLTYVTAFEKGWTASTLIWDVPSDFPPSGDPNDTRPPYQPVNYDGKFHGPVTVRSALANSFNVPAVKALQYVGIYDDPNTSEQDGFINFTKKLGITTLDRDDYGLSLTLGGGDVTLLELTGAFSVFANGGQRVPPVSILKIVDHTGNVVFEYTPPTAEQVIRSEHAYLISSILSDNQARTPMFGSNSVLNLPFTAAVKTGTTNDYRDNWTIGYTPDIAIGVWVGNADYTPMVNTSGLTGAAPIWSQMMQFANQKINNGNATAFNRPAGIVDRIICSVSGTEPSQWCPSQRSEIYAYDQLPLPKENDLWSEVKIDTWVGLLASAGCNDFVEEQFALNVNDSSARKWIEETSQGQAWAEQNGFKTPIFYTPSRECNLDDPRPKIIFAGLSENQVITSSPLDIYAVVDATSDFKKFRLQYGLGENPVEWKTLVDNVGSPIKDPGLLYSWDLLADKVESEVVTLRIYLESTRGDTYYAEKKIHLKMQVPTPTPTITPTFTVTPTPTTTPTPTMTVTPTLIPSQTSTVTPTTVFSETPSPTS